MKIGWHYQYFKYLLCVFRYYFRSDKIYRMWKFKKDFGFYPNLSSPTTFNEKILYRMITPIKEEYVTQLADKLRAREYVKSIHPDIVSVIYGVFKTVDDIDFAALPEKFVLKCNHDTGSFVICENKESFDTERARFRLSLHVKMNMYYRTREWQYKKIKPLIFCEEFIERDYLEGSDLMPDVFRFHCFNAKALFTEVEYLDKNKKEYTNIYDSQWQLQPVRLNGRPNTVSAMPMPEKFAQAISVAESLTQGLDYCRVDLYITDKKIYFSEFTFAPNNGREKFSPAEWDTVFGKSWDLER